MDKKYLFIVNYSYEQVVGRDIDTGDDDWAELYSRDSAYVHTTIEGAINEVKNSTEWTFMWTYYNLDQDNRSLDKYPFGRVIRWKHDDASINSRNFITIYAKELVE